MNIKELYPTDEELQGIAWHTIIDRTPNQMGYMRNAAKFAVDNAVKKIVEYLGNDRGFGLVKKVQALKELIKERRPR